MATGSLRGMDTYLAVVSKREVRDYEPRPLDPAAEKRILEAGRLAGSSKNRQARRFVVLRDPDVVERTAAAVYAPANVRGAALVVVVVVGAKGPTAFDAGRAAQNMMLAAWNEGIGSCPNGIADADALAAIVGSAPDEQVSIVLTFGHPSRPRDPETRTPAEWIDSADRRPLAEIVQEK
ncbi:MAG TPA: nitroreductase family protein [Solirubrobacteraceae bacterium]|nr:nitroreductase family protein [Solirubrobacteraceae bacterium]